MSDTPSRTYDVRFWQRGTAGQANIITYDAQDVVGVAAVPDRLVDVLVSKQNAGMERAIADLERQLAAVTAERDELLVEIDHCRDNADNAQRYEQERDAAILRAEAAEKDAQSKQAKIDALMIEYCPEEMSQAQWDEFYKHQVPVSQTEQAAIDAAMKES